MSWVCYPDHTLAALLLLFVRCRSPPRCVCQVSEFSKASVRRVESAVSGFTSTASGMAARTLLCVPHSAPALPRVVLGASRFCM